MIKLSKFRNTSLAMIQMDSSYVDMTKAQLNYASTSGGKATHFRVLNGRLKYNVDDSMSSEYLE